VSFSIWRIKIGSVLYSLLETLPKSHLDLKSRWLFLWWNQKKLQTI